MTTPVARGARVLLPMYRSSEPGHRRSGSTRTGDPGNSPAGALPSTVLLVMALVAGVAFAVVEIALRELNRIWHSGLGLGTASHDATFARHVLVRPGLGHLLAVFAAISAAFLVAKAAWSKRQTTKAWRLGSLGEKESARLLEPLESGGYVALHDLRIPGSRANIDHVVVGPNGVWIIETKRWSGKVVIRESKLLRNGRNEARSLEEAHREASVVRAALSAEEVPVRPVLCVHGAAIEVGWFSSTTIDGVRICSGRRIRRLIESPRPTPPARRAPLTSRRAPRGERADRGSRPGCRRRAARARQTAAHDPRPH